MNCERCGLEICIEHHHEGQVFCESCYSLITTKLPRNYQKRKCPVCEKKDWDTGTIEIGYLVPNLIYYDISVYYHSNKKKIQKERASLFGITCLNCGHVELIVDSQFVKDSIKK
jgi:hypothetical protein